LSSPIFNNSRTLLDSNDSLQSGAPIINTTNSSPSIPVTQVTSDASVNGSYLAQASSTSSDLYFSQNGSSWSMISQAALTTTNLVTLVESAISSNNYSGLYYIKTSTGSYQTATPSSLSTWVSAPAPTPIFQISGNQYTLYPNSNSLDTLGSINQYTVTGNVLPQNYDFTSAGWVLNIANFTTNSGQSLPNEYFNVAPVLLLTGKAWITECNGNTLLNANYLPDNIYSSQSITTWQAVNSNSAPITGIPVLF
jgi:hypothetical protein